MNICDLNQLTKESIEESMAEKKKPQESTHAGDKVSDMELSEIDEESEGPCPSFSKKRKTERREADEGSTQGDFLKEDITTTVKRLPPLQASGFSSYLSAPIRFPSKPVTDQLKDRHASLLKIWEKRVSGDIPPPFMEQCMSAVASSSTFTEATFRVKRSKTSHQSPPQDATQNLIPLGKYLPKLAIGVGLTKRRYTFVAAEYWK